MVQYHESSTFPTSRERVWSLLRAHLDDLTISRIHPLIRSQRTTGRPSEGVTVVERSIDVRGRLLASTWKITYAPPDRARWEIVASEGPWAPGSSVENTYADVPGGTEIRTHADVRISVLPFFLSQKRTVRRIFDDIEREDRVFAAGST